MNKLALISVSDKTNVVDFAQRLTKFNYQILATGNTAKLLKKEGIVCIEVQDYTKFPEVFSGRVKTLQPRIFGGILMRRDDESDLKEAEKNDINPIDVVCVNLYPFPDVVKRTDIDLQTKIENIDIGGPSLIRAAAKNYKYVSVLTNPDQYKEFLQTMEKGEVTIELKQKLAAAAFSHTCYYDTLIANFFEDQFKLQPASIRLNYVLQNELRYGENPHQSAFLYGEFYEYFDVLHGKELSFNNIVDLTAAIELVNDLETNSCAIIKHTNPCGAATAGNIYDAYVNALSCDPVSAFGGIIAFNGIVDLKTAEKLNELFSEIIVAPEFSEEALTELKKKKNRRLLKQKKPIPVEDQIKNIPGGLIVQSKDTSSINENNLKVVTNKSYSKEELDNLLFAWTVCKHTKSNTIIYVKDQKAIGVGAGQMSRIDSAKIAAEKAVSFGHDLKNSVAASDAFFPFPDALIEIASKGVTAVVQPGGSVRDQEVIDAANEQNICMVFTGIRNFKH